MISHRIASIGGTRKARLVLLLAFGGMTIGCGAYAKDSECRPAAEADPDCEGAPITAADNGAA